MKTQQTELATRLISASSREQVINALNGLTYEEGILGVRKAIDQTEDDIEFCLEEGYQSLASSKGSLLTYLLQAEATLLEKHVQESY